MSCRKFKSHIFKHYDKELSSEQEKNLNQHTKSCPSCKKELYQMDQLKKILSVVDILEPSPDFNDKLWARIGKPEEKIIPEISFTFKQKVKWALATCLVTIVLLSAIVLTDPRFNLFMDKSETVREETVPREYQILVKPDRINFVIDNYKPLPQTREVDNPKTDKDIHYILERRAYPQMITTGEHFVLPLVSTQSLIEESF